MSNKYSKKRKTRNIKKRKTSYKRKLKYTQKKRGGVFKFMKRSATPQTKSWKLDPIVEEEWKMHELEFPIKLEDIRDIEDLNQHQLFLLDLMIHYRSIMLEAEIKPTLEGFVALYMPENVKILENDKTIEKDPREIKKLFLSFTNAIKNKNKTATEAQKINFDDTNSPVVKGFKAIVDIDKLDIDNRVFSDEWKLIWKLSEPDEISQIMRKGQNINIYNKYFIGGKKKKTRRRGGFRPGLKLCLTKKNVALTKGPE